MEWIRLMLRTRARYHSSTALEDITERNCSLHSMPGSDEMAAAGWQINPFVAVSKQGHLVQYERFGSIVPKVVLEQLPLHVYERFVLSVYEGRSLVIHALSHRAKRVVRHVEVIDCKGIGFAHRLLQPYLNIKYDLMQLRTPDSSILATYLVGLSKIGATIFAWWRRLLFSGGGRSSNRGSTLLFSGDPFRDERFGGRFERAALPLDVHGRLESGSDQHCCVGVPPSPGITDAPALWQYYSARRRGRLQEGGDLVRSLASKFRRSPPSSSDANCEALEDRVAVQIEAMRDGGDGGMLSHPARAKETEMAPLGEQRLPEGWSAQVTDKGRNYYVHGESQKSTWTRPGVL